MDDIQAVEAFIGKWQGVTGSERANYQLFVTGLCDLLGVPQPDPASDDTRDNAYVFERRVSFSHGDGSTSNGFIDCYRRGAFVLEAKKVKAGSHTKGFDDALLRARAQGEGYARALPAAEGRPPFVAVVDVGHVIELYAEFSRSGATYTPFPDPRSHRIKLGDLRIQPVRERLKTLWLDPMALDPARVNAKVTREVAVQLAEVAKSLEAGGHSSHIVGAFLTRCLFSMFAEDVELLPRTASGDGAFVDLLKRYGSDPATLQRMMAALWANMDRGGFSESLAKDILRFNGKLFKASGSEGYALPLTRDQINGLLAAASADWKEVEPSIFGTLLERALVPSERHALGAHYTPRAYVERLVLPTVVEPLRVEWADSQAAALVLAQEALAMEANPVVMKENTKANRDAVGRYESAVRAKWREARQEIKNFHHRLCTVSVLDPACGSGNFLYVTLEHLKRLEGEVLNQLADLGESQDALAIGVETVTLQQLRGIELNERAAALAELVLWIGYLQWHIRTRGNKAVAEPVVHDYGNIENRDAVLTYDACEPLKDDSGNLVTRWDGMTFKIHPVTGEPVPDEMAQTPQWRYVNPRRADWPQADFIVGNPPFIGNKRMREVLGAGYAEALRDQSPDVPDTSDFVMYWWDHAAELTRTGVVMQFGLITTNSLRQTFNRKVVERHLSAVPPLSLRLAVPDHPWVDSANGAAVRIAMSVGVAGNGPGNLQTVIYEEPQLDGEVAVKFSTRRGIIHADMSIGANVAAANKLRANTGLCFQGFVLVGEGFVMPEEQRELIAKIAPSEISAIRAWKNGRDLSQGSRGHFVIDLFPLNEDQARAQYPHMYQHLLDRVKPFRDQVARRNHRERWWIWGEARPGLRAATAGLNRIIVTNFAAKHRYFVFESPRTALDHNMYVIGSDDALFLGVLSSRVHILWMLRAGSTLEDRPLWINSTCFLPFPFPDDDTGLTPELAQRIRKIAEQLDTHRKDRQATYDDVTLTGMYNTLEKTRQGMALTAKEKLIYEHGLVGVLRTLHDELDAAILTAYGWTDLNFPDDTDELLLRLVSLNSKRAGEEVTGKVRWLRPSFQLVPTLGEQAELKVEADETEGQPPSTFTVPTAKLAWPTGLTEQIKAVASVVMVAACPLDVDAIAAHFTARGRWRERLPTILETLEALGRIRQSPNDQWVKI